MDELSFDGKTYVSSKQAAKISGYAKDYIGQLCREGRIEARLVGRNWYVSEQALSAHRFGEGKEKAKVEVVKSEERRPIGAPAAANPTWEKSRYILDSGSEIPPLGARSSVSVLSAETPIDNHARLITEMQDAWQEWFTKKEGEAEVPSERDGEESTTEEEAAVPVELSVTDPREGDSGVDEEEGSEVGEAEILGEGEEAETQSVPIVRITETKVTRNVSPRPLPEPKEGLTPLGVLAYRTLLLGVSLVFVFLALVGTGFVTNVGGSKVTEIPVLKNIAGIAAIKDK